MQLTEIVKIKNDILTIRTKQFFIKKVNHELYLEYSKDQIIDPRKTKLDLIHQWENYSCIIQVSKLPIRQ